MTDKIMEDVNENAEKMSRREKPRCNVHSTGDAMRRIHNYRIIILVLSFRDIKTVGPFSSRYFVPFN